MRSTGLVANTPHPGRVTSAMPPAVNASRTPEAQRPEVSLPVGLRRHAPCDSPPSWNAPVNGPLHGQPVALAVASRGRHADMVLAGRQAGITTLMPTERGGRTASWRGEPTLTPAFTSPLHRAFRTCEPRRLRRSER